MQSAPTVSLVICTRNRPEHLRRCLEATARLSPAPDEIIVVDNTIGDGATQVAAREFGARYLAEPAPGLSRARNRGLQESNSEIIAYLDDDAIPQGHWLQSIIVPFADPRVAVVTGETLSEQKTSSEVGGESARYLSNQVPRWFEIATFGGLGVGANMAFRKSACVGWRGFDERLGRGAPLHGCEEHYAVASLISLGYSAVHTPNAVVIHPTRTGQIDQEAANAIAYWWFLFFHSPGHRLELIRFLFHRLLHKPLSWQRNPPELGPIISSGWRVQIKAAFTGTFLYIRARKLK